MRSDQRRQQNPRITWLLTTVGCATVAQISSGILRAERVEQAKKDGVELDMKALGLEIHNLTKYADYQQMEKVRARADILVKDAETAEALKPYYQQFCKRPCFHDDYLDTFNRESVTLVDTGGEGIERITPKGVVVNGQELEVDCIVMATGFVRRTVFMSFCVWTVLSHSGQSLDRCALMSHTRAAVPTGDGLQRSVDGAAEAWLRHHWSRGPGPVRQVGSGGAEDLRGLLLPRLP